MLGTLRQCLTGLGLAAVVLFLGGCEHASRLDSSEPPVSPASSRDAAALVDAGGTLTAHFFDVGQGDCTLLAGPDFTIVIDAGRHDRQDVVPHLRAAGVESIDLLIGTHPHADHIGQIPQIMAAFPVAEVWMSGDTHTSRTFERALDAVLESGAGYHEPRAGENHHFGSAYVQVLHPEKVTGNLNDGSVSVRISFGNVAFVFTGDAEAESELSDDRGGVQPEGANPAGRAPRFTDLIDSAVPPSGGPRTGHLLGRYGQFVRASPRRGHRAAGGHRGRRLRDRQTRNHSGHDGRRRL
jgi:glyoxylase-like metal-dependent hydrolase (beta-lactamase superfamily II)